jgi:hypothetical protein
MQIILEFPVVRKTVSAVYWPAFGGFERYFGLNTAVRTGHFCHFPWSAVTAETSGISPEISVIKSHFRFTSALADSCEFKNKIVYTFKLKNKNWFLITDYTSLYFQ